MPHLVVSTFNYFPVKVNQETKFVSMYILNALIQKQLNCVRESTDLRDAAVLQP